MSLLLRIFCAMCRLNVDGKMRLWSEKLHVSQLQIIINSIPLMDTVTPSPVHPFIHFIFHLSGSRWQQAKQCSLVVPLSFNIFQLSLEALRCFQAKYIILYNPSTASDPRSSTSWMSLGNIQERCPGGILPDAQTTLIGSFTTWRCSGSTLSSL